MAGTERDKQIGRNLAAMRGELSQDDLAARMKGRGYKWSQSTVWSIERGDRPLRLTEALDVLQCLSRSESDIWELLESSDTSREVRGEIKALEDARDALVERWHRFELQRRSLAVTALWLDSDGYSHLRDSLYEALRYSAPQEIMESVLRMCVLEFMQADVSDVTDEQSTPQGYETYVFNRENNALSNDRRGKIWDEVASAWLPLAVRSDKSDDGLGGIS